MDRKEFLINCATLILAFIVIGAIFGIILNIVGYSHIGITSWQFWLMYFAINTPMISSVILNRYNVPIQSALGSIINIGAVSIVGLIISAFMLERPIDLRQLLLSVGAVSGVVLILHYVIPHSWVQAQVQSMKNYFSRK